MNVNTLSKRLRLVASYLPEQANFADIGSDHAYLPCYVCLNDPQAKAIAGEVNDGPYQSAKRTVEEFSLHNQISVRKGDGLAVIQENEVSEITIAGMGGGLIKDILEKGKDKLKGISRIIAQPNVDAHVIRKWFYQNNYQLVDEKIIEEDGHIYEIVVGDKGSSNSIYSATFREKEFIFGPYLLKDKSDAFKQKWESEKQKKQLALNQMQKAREPDRIKMDYFKAEIQAIQEVLHNE